MKTDENYIYPETPEELAMFYGWECQNLNGLNVWHDFGKVSNETLKRQLDGTWPRFRIKLPTLSDLKVGDVVRVKGGKDETIYINHETKLNWIVKAVAQMRPVSLLIGRNTWIPVKCN